MTLTPIPASPLHTRTITLGYSSLHADCSLQAPYRALTTIQETAVGVDSPQVALPPIEFQYGSASLLYQADAPTSLVPWSASAGFGPIRNLGWGRRFKDAGDEWPTVEAMMLDVDGDSRIDRIQSEPVYETGTTNVKYCRARWYRNVGSGSFQAKGYIYMPTLKWATAIGSSDPYAGGAYAGAHASEGVRERCALNYQRTAYINSADYGGDRACHTSAPGDPVSQLVPCPTDRNYCGGPTVPSPTYSDCRPNKAGEGTDDTVFAWRWFDINGDSLPDLIGSPVRGGLERYDLQWGNKLYNPGTGLREPNPEPTIFGAFPACPSTSFTSSTNPAGDPYTMCGSMFPWFVYLNHGNGSFGRGRPISPGTPVTHGTYGPEPDDILYQPIPLETANGDSSILSHPVGEEQGTIDIDGDGHVDAVRRSSASSWSVFRNDGAGWMVPSSGSAPFAFATGNQFSLYRSDLASGSTEPQTLEGLVDINGDGLVDHWTSAAGSSTASIQLSDGLQFRLADGITTSKPGPDAASSIATGDAYFQTGGPGGGDSWFVCRGSRTDTRRSLDVNGDGRVDVISPGSLFPEIAFNQGGQFGSPAAHTGTEAGLLRRIVVTSDSNQSCQTQFDANQPFWWEIRSDMIDLDGDSIVEAVDFGDSLGTPPAMNVSRVAELARQPRLLVQINNHRGATTTITYSSVNGPAVERVDPYRFAPHTRWVVQSISTADSLANTTTTTSYRYIEPVFNRDPDLKTWGFRGFDRVETTMPSGAKTVEYFGYGYSTSKDWSGRLEKTLVMPAASEQTVANEVRSIDETSWQQRTLFNGAIKTYHPMTVDHWTCKNGQDEFACRDNLDTRTRTVVAQLSALASTTGPDMLTPLMWQETVTRLQDGEIETPATASTTGTRRTTATFALAADATTYRLRSTGTTREELRSTGYEVYAKAATIWDASDRVATDEDVWFSNPAEACTDTASHCARTHRVFDMNTGNVIERVKPAQWAAGGFKKESYLYDSRKLFPATETNEVGHVRDHLYEYGTGTKLETQGPNIPPCAVPVPHTCPPDAPTKELHRIRVDGLGRTIERFETHASPGNNYVLHKVEIDTYVDGPAASVTRETAIDYNQYSSSTRYRTETTKLDGHGRAIEKTVHALGSAPADDVTTFVYRDDGTLGEVRGPDPTQNNASVVSYRYTFDSLGRPTSMRRPDSVNPAEQSGVNLSYDGLVSTTSEVVGVGGGLPASTILYSDAFGRLARVEEHVDEQLGSVFVGWAATTYDQGPDDSVARIVNPAGVTTCLYHDFAARRTAVARGNTPSATCPDAIALETSGLRTWRYGYDRNGNVASEVSPCEGASCGLYTTTTVYDAADRPASKLLAHRDLSSQDLALFGADTETFHWDGGNNGKGRLGYWKTFAPGAATPTMQSEHWYTAVGQHAYEKQTSNVAGYTNLQRKVFSRFNLSGQLADTFFYDVVGTQKCLSGSLASYWYDARGLPYQVQLQNCVYAGTPDNSASYLRNQRNVAGLVTRRYAIPGVPAIPPSEARWSYDRLGRVTNQTVEEGSPLGPVVRQDLWYFGNDDPSRLDHYLGASRKQLDFTFDRRHQLRTVVESTTPGYFAADYQYKADGRFQHAVHAGSPQPGGNVTPRDVEYEYQGEDPDHVTALVASGAPSPLASYAYDRAGNQTMRCAGSIAGSTCSGESVSYQYDGKNQLRRATKRNASGLVVGSEEYWYDHNGSRNHVVKRDAVGDKTEMIWFMRGNVEAHYDAAGTVMRVFGHVDFGTPVFRLDRHTDAGATVEYLFHGLANNAIAAVDRNTGMINASFNYAPFGEIIEATDGGAPTNGIDQHRRRMNDKYIDEISELAYYGFRYYDKTSMTWTQSDPLYRVAPDLAMLGSPRRANLYGFSLNNPLRYLDPDGLDGKRLSSYRSEMEQSTHHRASLEGDSDWMVEGCENFSEQCATSSGTTSAGNTESQAQQLWGPIIRIGVGVAVAGGRWVARKLAKRRAAKEAARKASEQAKKEAAEKAQREAAEKAAETALPDSYWINKQAPTQVTPGTRTVNIDKASSSGGTYHSTTHYDQYGRQIGQTHRTTHGRGDHPNPHHHRRDPATGERLRDPATGSRTWRGFFGN